MARLLSNSRPATAGAMATPQRTITLTPIEQLIRDFVIQGSESFPGLQIWIAGGWVRDRLLGIPSSDIDLALSNLTGRQFGTFLEVFSSKPEVVAKYSIRAAELNLPHKAVKCSIIDQNSEKAKPLETARVTLFGLKINLVNLRKELYSKHSRTSEMQFGTPEEDALRRDATVNALLCNLKTQQVVDFTGGLADLDAKVMRTPMDPISTFLEDPLRVLRLIRIAGKLGFSIDPETQRCMATDDIRHALDAMVDRDRINVEIFKMIRDSRPIISFQRLFDCNLFVPLFVRFDSPVLLQIERHFPVTELPWPAAWQQSYKLLAQLLENTDHIGSMVRQGKNLDHLWIMAAYTSMAVLRETMLNEVVQDATQAIRATAKITKLLERTLNHFDSIRILVDAVATAAETVPKSKAGMAIRSWGEEWTTQVTYVLMTLFVHAKNTCEISLDGETKTANSQDILDRFRRFAKFVFEHKLQFAHLERPLLDGNEILGVFGLKAGGKFLNDAIDGIIAWKFDNENGTAEAAEAWLLTQRDSLGIPQG